MEPDFGSEADDFEMDGYCIPGCPDDSCRDLGRCAWPTGEDGRNMADAIASYRRTHQLHRHSTATPEQRQD